MISFNLCGYFNRFGLLFNRNFIGKVALVALLLNCSSGYGQCTPAVNDTAFTIIICSGDIVNYDLNDNVTFTGSCSFAFCWSATTVPDSITGATITPTSDDTITDELVNTDITAHNVLYTVNIKKNSTCSGMPFATFNITIKVNPDLDAGTGDTISVCSSDDPIYLFDSLGGMPASGGSWSGGLTGSAGAFDPASDTSGTYTYTVGEAGCTNSATVVVTVVAEPNAGTGDTISVCSSDDPIYLFDSLGGMPASGGSWSGGLTGSAGAFDPASDTAGNYTYSINAPPCSEQTAAITVVLEQAPSAGSPPPDTVRLCNTPGHINLFTLLDDMPDTTGSWSPELTSGYHGSFNPSINSSGTYTYKVKGTICSDDSAQIEVLVSPGPDTPALAMLPSHICSSSQALSFTVDPLPGISYIWNSSTSSGSGLNTPYATFDFPNPGDFDISLTAQRIFVSAADTLRCFATFDTTVTVSSEIAHDAPAVTLTQPGNTLVCLNNEVDAYQWGYDSLPTLKPNIIPGEVFQDYIAGSAFDTTRYYYWVETTIGTCTTKSYLHRPPAYVGINSALSPKLLHIYPNPSSGSFLIDYSTLFESNLELQIFDMNGSIIHQEQLTNTQSTKYKLIEGKHLFSGMYLIRISKRGKTIAASWIVVETN